MKLIQSIINDLLETDKSLTSPLLKTKVLAKKLNNEELLTWVNNEHIGYSGTDNLPRYRYTLGQLLGSYTVNGRTVVTNQPIMASMVDKEFSDFVNRSPINMSVESMESLLAEEKTGRLILSLPAEVLSSISRAYREEGNYGFQLLTARIETSKTALVQALSEIRSKLLDLMLELESKYGDIDIDHLVKEKSTVNSIIIENMNNNLIDGDGNIINTGSKVKISNSITINKGDRESLSNLLKDNGMQVEDIDEIIEIIDQEEPDYETKKLGRRASEWMKKMIGKSIDGSWQIGVGAAGELLATALGNYYGMG